MPYQSLAVPWPLSLLLDPVTLLSPDLRRQELLTPWSWPNRQHGEESSAMSPSLLPDAPHSLHVLLVGNDTVARHALRTVVAEQLAAAQVTEVQGFADAVMLLARGGVHLVVLDLAHLAALSAGAPLLLRGLAPGARLLGFGPLAAAQAAGLEHVDDLLELSSWLRRAGRR